MLVPTQIPNHIAHIVETARPPQLDLADGGVYGSTNSGVGGDGVIGSILNGIQTAFAALLITFMLYIAFFDVGDWLRSAYNNQNSPVIFAPRK